MIKTHKYSDPVKAFIQTRLSSFRDRLAQLLSRKTMTEEGYAFSFLPGRMSDEPLACFEEDTLEVRGTEAEEMGKREAAFIYQFLQTDTSAGLLLAGLRPQNLPSFPGLTIAFVELHSGMEVLGRTTYGVISLNGGDLDAVTEFWSYLGSGQPIACFLAYLPDGFTEISRTTEIHDPLLSSIAAQCQHVILSAFGHYGKVIWTWTANQFKPAVSASNTIQAQALSNPVRIELDRFTLYYFQQKLCGTVWRTWAVPYPGSMYESGQFWCVSPISPDPFFGCYMGGAFRQAYPQVTELCLQQARRKAAQIMSTYLDTYPNAFLLGAGRFVWAPDADPVLSGRSADGAFRIVVHTDQKSKHAGEMWSMSYVFKAVLGGIDTARCVEETWQAPPGKSYCSIVIKAPQDPFAFIRDASALTITELEESLRPATTCIVVGGFRNDLPLIWSKEVM